jgi:hypothetical protein
LISDTRQKNSLFLYLYPKIQSEVIDKNKLFAIELVNKDDIVQINSNVDIKIKLLNPNGTCFTANYLVGLNSIKNLEKCKLKIFPKT